MHHEGRKGPLCSFVERLVICTGSVLSHGFYRKKTHIDKYFQPSTISKKSVIATLL